jgi:hypothetical protein
MINNKQYNKKKDKRQNKTNEHKKHLLNLYFPEYDPVQYEDIENDYYKFYHYKLVQNRIQSLHDNYKKEHNNTSPSSTIYNGEHQLA